MKIFIHGNGDFSKEINRMLVKSKYFNKYYMTELKIGKKKYINHDNLKGFGFSHTETLKDFNVNKIKKYPHLICSSKKQDVFEKFIIDNDLESVKYLLINSPIIKKKNHIGVGFIAAHAYLGDQVYYGNYSYIGPMCVIGNRVKIGNKCAIFQKNSIDRNVEVGDNTIITVNVFINKDIKIGKNCYIAPNQIITENIPDNCAVMNGKIIRGFYET
jgi:UDP-3-O-[3-hydroxymyristoyl] glucosamine N-acyltransferase